MGLWIINDSQREYKILMSLPNILPTQSGHARIYKIAKTFNIYFKMVLGLKIFRNNGLNGNTFCHQILFPCQECYDPLLSSAQHIYLIDRQIYIYMYIYIYIKSIKLPTNQKMYIIFTFCCVDITCVEVFQVSGLFFCLFYIHEDAF